MVSYEDSVLGKLSANLQQQAEILKKLSTQKGKGGLETRELETQDNVLEKAKQIGKRLRNTSSSSKKKPRVYEDVDILLNICQMSETRSGDYKRFSGFVEIEVSKADNYEIVIRKIAACLEIEKSDVYSYGIVVLETFTGLQAYDKTREDKQLVEFMDEQIRDIDKLKESQDSKGGSTMEHYLVIIYHKILQCCLRKHSKRSDTNQVMTIWNETNFD